MLPSAGLPHPPFTCLPSPFPALQVHEKSILLALLPLTMLLGGEQPQLLAWLNLVTTFSMLPLLKKDGLALATVGVTAACHASIQLASVMGAAGAGSGSKKQRAASTGALPAAWHQAGFRVSVAGCAAILASAAVLPAPAKLPFLYDALITSWSFLHFAALFVYTNGLQLQEYRRAGTAKLKDA